MAASGGACVEVSATDGPMPETADHFTRIGSTGASTVEVSLVNCHAVGDEELLELIEQEIHSVASECGLTVTSISRA